MGNGMFILLIILATFAATYRGLKQFDFQNRYLFRVDDILRGREYYRMISSGFLHNNWFHFAMNMFVLWHFAQVPGTGISWLTELLVLYFGSIIAGSALSLYVHRWHGDYSAVGASGGTSGLVLAYTVIFPLADMRLLFIPIDIPLWLLGVAFIVYTISGIRNQAGNIGHEAHLGGAVFGMLVSCAFHPLIALANWWIVLLVMTP